MAAFPSESFGNEVLYAVDAHGVALITLNAPARMNSLSRAMILGLQAALDLATEDDNVRCIVLTGSGSRAFSVGGDLSSADDGAATGFRAQGGDAAVPFTARASVRALRFGMEPSITLRECDVPTIAAVNGACAGAAISLACACDMRFCSDRALFRTAFVSAGLSGDFGGSWTLPRVVGPAKARELYLLNAKISPTEAKAIGLVSEVFPAEKTLERTLAIARRVAAGAPLATRRAKQNLNDAERLSFADACDAEAERHGRCAMHPDAMEAGAAFLAKRDPSFEGTPAQELWRMSKL